MDYIQWKDVKRWCVLTDKDGNSVKNMGGLINAAD